MRVLIHTASLIIFAMPLALAEESESDERDTSQQSETDTTEVNDEKLKRAVAKYFEAEIKKDDDSGQSNPSLRLEAPPTGEWTQSDGTMECDGYLARVESDEYCVVEIPADWQLLEFNGKTYYVQPLS